MEVSWNRGTHKTSILIGFSIRNRPFWASCIPIYGNPHMIISPMVVYYYVYNISTSKKKTISILFDYIKNSCYIIFLHYYYIHHNFPTHYLPILPNHPFSFSAWLVPRSPRRRRPDRLHRSSLEVPFWDHTMAWLHTMSPGEEESNTKIVAPNVNIYGNWRWKKYLFKLM